MTGKNLPEMNQFSGQTIDDYILETEIGRGNIGVVYRARHKDIQDLLKACKIIPSSNLKPHWENELTKVGKLSGIPQVVQHQAHGSKILDGEKYIYIFWEYVPGKDLREYAKSHPKSITLPFVENLLRQVLIVFHAMKETGITHDDLHDGNILVHASDPRFPTDEPRFKISDFGIGGSRNYLKPKDDYAQLAAICHGLLAKYVDPSELDGEFRRLYDSLIEEFLPKRILENNPVVGSFVKNPKELLREWEDFRSESAQDVRLESLIRLTHPFDYLSCEHIGNAFVLLQRLYSENFPGYDELLQRNNTILTGPRGCGKTTIFRNLGLKAQLLSQGPQSPGVSSFVGIYYYCGDLYYAFPYLKDEPSETQRRSIVHYFNLALLCEVIDTLIVANKNTHLTLDTRDIQRLQQYLVTWLPDYEQPPQGTDTMRHMLAFVTTEKQRFRTQLATLKKHEADKQLLPLDFIPSLCKMLGEQISWIKDKPIYFLIDDYSLPRISRGIQTTLNDFLFGRYPECIFKISTESVTTFFPYDSKNKLLEETREYDVIDLGGYFLHAQENVRRAFLQEVINNRLKNSEGIHPNYHDIAAILGNSHYKSSNDMALEIREASAGTHASYYGWDIVTELCSGDIAHMLRLIRDIFSAVGGYKRFSTADISLPLDRKLQDHAIREIGNDFLARVEAVPETGKELRQIAEAFGTVANWYLRNRNSKNQTNNPPWQAFRIEVRQTPYFNDKHLERKYNDLLRCAVFLRDVRGKSQRGAVVPRLYLRRLLLPTFLLTPSQRDNIGLEVNEFFLLLSDPQGFVEHMKKKKRQDDMQVRMI